MKRKSISKKTRFEVFKRDGFKCQYCGRSAPEDFVCVKQFESRMGLTTTNKDTGTRERPKRVEKLFMHNSLVTNQGETNV